MFFAKKSEIFSNPFRIFKILDSVEDDALRGVEDDAKHRVEGCVLLLCIGGVDDGLLVVDVCCFAFAQQTKRPSQREGLFRGIDEA